MSKVWKVVLIIALVLAVLGIVLAAIGYFTGGSAERMIEVLFGGREVFELTLELLKQELADIFAAAG